MKPRRRSHWTPMVASVPMGLSVISAAHAYPTYQRLGYVSCTACHYLPTGGGLLTPYGRNVQGALSLFAQDIEPADKPVNQGLQARMIELNPSGSLSSNGAANPFLMQADYLASAFITRKVRVDAVVGANLDQSASGHIVDVADSGGWNGVVLRRMLFTGIVDDSSQIQVGRDFYPAGLNIEDHTSFLKEYNKRGETDYPTQFRYVHQSDSLQLLPYAFGPSFEESAGNQEAGAGMRAEYALDNSNSVGALAQIGDTSALSRSLGSVFVRLSPSHWSGFVSENVFTYRQPHTGAASFDQDDVYLKPYIALPDWIETGWVYEYLIATNPQHQVLSQFGPSVNLRVVDWLSILGDGRDTATNGNSSWNFYVQAFLHIQI